MGKRAYRNPDHIRRRNMPAPSSDAVETHLNDLLSPIVYSQLNYYRRLGLRSKILTLPLMVAAVRSVAVATSALGARVNSNAEPGGLVVGKSSGSFSAGLGQTLVELASGVV